MSGLVVLAGLSVVVIFALGVMWRGYALAVLWGWFIVPTFGLPTLGIATAIGMSLVVGSMTYQVRAKEDEPNELAAAIAHAALGPLLALGFGWCVKAFM